MVLGDRNISRAISGNDRWVDEQRQEPELGGGQGGGTWRGPAGRAGKLPPEVFSLPDKGSELRAPDADFVDLTEKGLRRSKVGQREMASGELDSGLHGQVRQA